MKGKIIGYDAEEATITIRLYVVPKEIPLDRDVEVI